MALTSLLYGPLHRRLVRPLCLCASIFACATPVSAAERVTVHGKIWLEDRPVCALVLSHGQSMFSCQPRGEYSLNAPLNAQGELSVSVFATGMAPYKKTFTPHANSVRHDVYMKAEIIPLETRRIHRGDPELPLSAPKIRLNDISSNGRYVALTHYFHHTPDTVTTFLYDRYTGETSSIDQAHSARFAKDGQLMGIERWLDGTESGAVRSAASVYEPQSESMVDVDTTFDGTSPAGSCGRPALSAEAIATRYAAFACAADNIVADDGNGSPDVFIRDLTRGATKRVDYMPDAGWTLNDIHVLDIAADGSKVLFTAFLREPSEDGGGNRQLTYLYDRGSALLSLIDLHQNPSPGDLSAKAPPRLGGNGRFVVFDTTASLDPETDNNNLSDVYVYDTQSEEYQVVSVRTESSDGAQAPGLKPTNGSSHFASMSSDGRYVMFTSFSDELLPNEMDMNDAPDVFVHDRLNKQTRLASVSSQGLQLKPGASLGLISSDGRWLAFGQFCIDVNQCFGDIYLSGPLYHFGRR